MSLKKNEKVIRAALAAVYIIRRRKKKGVYKKKRIVTNEFGYAKFFKIKKRANFLI